jgi:Na+/H+ antiporter NhaB
MGGPIDVAMVVGCHPRDAGGSLPRDGIVSDITPPAKATSAKAAANISSLVIILLGFMIGIYLFHCCSRVQKIHLSQGK